MSTATNLEERIEIIVIDDKEKVLRILSGNLEAALKSSQFETFFGLPVKIQAFTEVKAALAYLSENRWRYVKTIILDYELQGVTNTSLLQEPSGVEFINLVKEKNSSIDIWGISAHDPESISNLQNETFRHFRQAVTGTLSKEDLMDGKKCIDSVHRILINPLREKVSTPFFDEFKKYVEQSTKSWHVPGHNRGQSLYNSKFGRTFFDFFGDKAFTSDHDVPKKFGSIYSNDNAQESIIGETQKLVAKTFNTQQTFFVTNGNSASNNIILLSILKPKDEVLVARSCHKSIHYAMVLSGAKPTYLNSKFSSKYEIMAPPAIAEIEACLKEKPAGTYKLLIVTGCSYEGLVMDIDRVNTLCKQYSTELFVDEAWYGYSNFHPQFQKTSATRLGVPYVTQSAHKMLSAFRQSAFIHINNRNFDFDFFKDIYNTFTSTSPQYQLIASMDIAAMQMRIEGFELIDKALERAELFRADIANYNLKKIKLLDVQDLRDEFLNLGFDFEKEGITYDPLKISFDISALGINVKDAFDFIRAKAGVDLIKYTKNCIQILFTIGTAFDRNKASELASTLMKLEANCDMMPAGMGNDGQQNFELPNFEYNEWLPRDYFYAKRRAVPLSEATGKFSATLVTPYPPGIPILVPGEPITKSHVTYLQNIKRLGHISVHGLKSDKIYICDGPTK